MAAVEAAAKIRASSVIKVAKRERAEAEARAKAEAETKEKAEKTMKAREAKAKAEAEFSESAREWSEAKGRGMGGGGFFFFFFFFAAVVVADIFLSFLVAFFSVDGVVVVPPFPSLPPFVVVSVAVLILEVSQPETLSISSLYIFILPINPSGIQFRSSERIPA